MDTYEFQWKSPAGPVTLSWVGRADVVPARVYAVAFVSAHELLLVSEEDPDNSHLYLPGGGVEEGETAEEALARELIEEADATIVAKELLGSQRVVDPRSG